MAALPTQTDDEYPWVLVVDGGVISRYASREEAEADAEDGETVEFDPFDGGAA